jgi:predicted nuclease of predicted toxin-antitoxin system
MKFLLDDNVPLSVKEWLKAKGIDAVRASDVGLKGAEDDRIFEYALENAYRIITLDLDFGYLFLRYQKGTVIVLRPAKAIPPEIINSELLNRVKMIEKSKR